MSLTRTSDVPLQDQAHPTIKNIDVTHIQLDPPAKYSLAADVFEVVTGVSGSAITVGGKITAGTIIYTGHESLETSTANKIFWIGSLSATILDFLLIPLGYLYKFYKKEDVPFNRENNLKWALAGLTLLLAIISAAAPITAQVISFINAGIAIIVGIVAVIRYFYDYRQTGEQFHAAIEKVQSLTVKVMNDMQEINDLQDQIRLLNEAQVNTRNTLNPLIVQLVTTYQRYNRHCEKLKTAHQLKNALERKFIRQKSPVELVANTLKFVLAGGVLAGTIVSLNPDNAFIGMGLLASVAIISLITIVAKKVIQIVQKRHERHQEQLRNRDIEISNSNRVINSVLLDHPSPKAKKKPAVQPAAKPVNGTTKAWRSELYARTTSETVPLLKDDGNQPSDEETNEDLQTEIVKPTML